MTTTAKLADLGAWLEPRSIAVLGASAEPKGFGGRVFHYLLLHQFPGQIYPINPKYSEVRGLPCFPSVLQVPGPIDLAFLSVPAAAVLPSLRECAEKGVKLAIVISSGFAEVDAAGAELQQEMVDLARRSGMRILGPNCLGLVNVPSRVVLAATGALALPELCRWPGPVSFLSQSGALGFGSVFNRGYDHGLGYRYVVTSGNECDLQAGEILGSFARDPETRVIAGLLEGLRDPEAFCQAAELAADAGKPMVILKIGRSEEAKRAAAAHTAALAGSDDVHDAVFRRYGVVRVEDLDDLWEIPALFSHVPLPGGRRVGVVTTSGGINGILADQLPRVGLTLPELSSPTTEELRRALPPYVLPRNPIDLSGAFVGSPREGEVFSQMLRLLHDDERIDIIVLVLMMVRPAYDELLAPIVDTIRQSRKPIVILGIGGSVTEPGLNNLHRRGVQLFRSPVRCARALGHLCDYADFQRQWQGRARPAPRVARAPQPAPSFRPGLLNPDQARALLESYGLPLARQKLAIDLADVQVAATRLGFPVVLKGAPPGLVHKSEAGVVKLGLRDTVDLARAYQELQERLGPSPVLVQEMVDGGVEMIVGLQRDPQFGPVVLLGMGGVLVELLGDRALGLPPLDREQVLDMLLQLRGRRLLEGFRGQPAADVDALVEVVIGLSRLAEDLGDHVEAIDLNPVIVRPAGRGAVIVDARVIWRDPAEEWSCRDGHQPRMKTP